MSSEHALCKRFRQVTFLLVAALSIFVAGSPSALGQVDEGSINGVVQDSTGAVIPNAQVTLLNTDQGNRGSATTPSR